MDQDEIDPNIQQIEEGGLKLGMLVYTEDEAYQLYNNHALNKGFSIRRDQIRYKHGTKIIRQRTYVCSKQGFSYNGQDVQELTRRNLDTRTGCGAHIIFDVKDDVWEIVRFNDEHNHDFVQPELRHFLRSGRNIPDDTKGMIDSMVDVGIGPTKARNYIAKQVGGVRNITFTSSDCHNYVQSRRSNWIEPTDAQMLVNQFKLKQAQDPMFFYTIQVDKENRLTNFFWRDGVSKLDNDCFGDVVIFDTTFRTNKYNMICAPFVGINHHWQSVLLGCAFLLDDNAPSFVWLFQAFLQAMGKAPQTIYTDQEKAMSTAIGEVFTDTCHRLCDWHIFKNAPSNIPTLFADSEFKNRLRKCFYGCESEDEFESTWKSMIEKWNASENKWLNNLYGLKRKWCPVFSNDRFTANIRSTQISESMNNVFKRITKKTMTLVEFFRHYEESVENQRENEAYEDFRCHEGKPPVGVSVGILNHAAELYTCKIFEFFSEQFYNSVAEKIIEHFSDGTSDFYTLRKDGQIRKRQVVFKASDNTISCSCKKFETMGVWCCHILRIVNVKTDIDCIPHKYIVKRWTKSAKEGMVMDRYKELIQDNSKESKTIRMSMLMRKAFFAMNIGAFDDKTVEMAEECMDQLIKKIGTYKANLCSSADIDTNSPTQHEETLLDKVTLQNPPHKKARGQTNARIKSQIEKRTKRKAKVTPRAPRKTNTKKRGDSLDVASVQIPISSTEPYVCDLSSLQPEQEALTTLEEQTTTGASRPELGILGDGWNLEDFFF